jgi:hypothetical protein
VAERAVVPERDGAREVRTRFTMFFERKGGKIWRIRNYNCFEPW